MNKKIDCNSLKKILSKVYIRENEKQIDEMHHRGEWGKERVKYECESLRQQKSSSINSVVNRAAMTDIRTYRWNMWIVICDFFESRGETTRMKRGVRIQWPFSVSTKRSELESGSDS